MLVDALQTRVTVHENINNTGSQVIVACRSLDSDLLMLLLRDTLAANKNLTIILMSATADSQLFARYFRSALVAADPVATKAAQRRQRPQAPVLPPPPPAPSQPLPSQARANGSSHNGEAAQMAKASPIDADALEDWEVQAEAVVAQPTAVSSGRSRSEHNGTSATGAQAHKNMAQPAAGPTKSQDDAEHSSVMASAAANGVDSGLGVDVAVVDIPGFTYPVRELSLEDVLAATGAI